MSVPGNALCSCLLDEMQMAEAPTNGLKRPHPNDDLHDGDSSSKRIRTPNGSPATQPTKPDASKLIADARARAEAVRARLQGVKGVNGGPTTPATPAAAPAPATRAPMTKLEEMRARVAALTGKTTAQSQSHSTTSPAPSYQPPGYDDGLSRARGGLSAALHPSLLESGSTAPAKGSKSASSQRSQPVSKATKAKKQLDLSGPSQEELRQNPYVDASIATTMRNRNPKPLKFLEKGKYIAQAAAMRRQHQLEEMKRRIAMQSRKVGISEDPSDKNFVVEAPPLIEWWDEGLVANPAKGYTEPYKTSLSDESPITVLEVHPISIAKPTNPIEIKPMYLTSKEQAKLRRQRRMADLKEYQMKVRLGMEPPDPPKVKRGNMMRVLGEEAVKDPTAVEARVNREIADRHQKHVDMNETRQLSKDARNEKLEAKKAADLAKGVILSVYKIDSLANGRNFFKVQKNFEQVGALGLILSSPKFSLVLCEAGPRGTQLYKKLILNRIDVNSPSPSHSPFPLASKSGHCSLQRRKRKETPRLTHVPMTLAQWTENLPSLHAATADDDDEDDTTTKPNNKSSSAAKTTPSWLQPSTEDGTLKDLSTNKAQLVFEGEEKSTAFRKVTTRSVETDKEAMELLERVRMGNFWTLARSLP